MTVIKCKLHYNCAHCLARKVVGMILAICIVCARSRTMPCSVVYRYRCLEALVLGMNYQSPISSVM